MTTTHTTAPKTIAFCGQRYRTTSLRAEVESIARDWGFSPDELVESALLNLAARREFGRGAWVRSSFAPGTAPHAAADARLRSRSGSVPATATGRRTWTACSW